MHSCHQSPHALPPALQSPRVSRDSPTLDSQRSLERLRALPDAPRSWLAVRRDDPHTPQPILHPWGGKTGLAAGRSWGRRALQEFLPDSSSYMIQRQPRL